MNFIKSKQFKIFLISLAGFITVIAVAFGIYSLTYQNRIFYDVKIGKISLAGLTQEQAKEKLSSKINEVSSQDLILNYQNKQWKLSSSDLQISYNLDQTVNAAYSIGRRGNIWQKIKEPISLLFNDKKILTVFSYDKNKKDNLFNNIYSEIDNPSQDAQLKLEKNDLIISSEKSGQLVNREDLESSFNSEIGFIEDRSIPLIIETDNPKVLAAGLENIKNQAKKVIDQPIALKYEDKNFQFNNTEIFSWLEIVAINTNQQKTGFINHVFAKDSEYLPTLIINDEKIKAEVGKISQNVNKDAVDAKLSMADGKASIFVPSSDGYQLDQAKTLQLIENILQNRLKVAGFSTEGNTQTNNQVINLPVEVKKPTVSNETINNLGINELIGKGTTSFKKSPSNRITNIKVGTSIFNGVLIKPGEEFSALQALGDVSTERGFLPELVIKEDSTKPEVGGGLCQVSTTLFRAALNTGLPITDRTNHKYRVSYYEPPVGMDATIYEPAPDLKFKNDTTGYILIQAYVSGTDLTFEFYGTKDNRQVEISDPVMYDVTSPPDPLYLEDASIVPGETKQKEKAHNGAKASFHYKVTKDGQTTFEKTFVSSYVPWRAVILVAPGELPGSQPPADQAPAPTPTPAPAPDQQPAPTT